MSAGKSANWFKKWAWEYSGFRKYGLYYDDILHETPVVKEAIKRLPEHVRNERYYRQLRATQLNIQKSILPREQWSKYEDDVRYLSPLVEQVEKEWKEKAEWSKLY